MALAHPGTSTAQLKLLQHNDTGNMYCQLQILLTLLHKGTYEHPQCPIYPPQLQDPCKESWQKRNNYFNSSSKYILCKCIHGMPYRYTVIYGWIMLPINPEKQEFLSLCSGTNCWLLFITFGSGWRNLPEDYNLSVKFWTRRQPENLCCWLQ